MSETFDPETEVEHWLPRAVKQVWEGQQLVAEAEARGIPMETAFNSNGKTIGELRQAMIEQESEIQNLIRFWGIKRTKELFLGEDLVRFEAWWNSLREKTLETIKQTKHLFH
jgi:hypothetical protein